MISGKCKVGTWWVCALFCCVLVARAQAPADPGDAARDTLVYKDGDRIHGHVLRHEGGLIVFKSDRFGELKVKEDDAVIIKAEKAPVLVEKQVVAEGIRPAKEAEQRKEEERKEEERVSIWERFSPAVLTAKVRDYFGPWNGRLALSDELVTDSSHHNAMAFEAKLKRTFPKDAVELSSRYDYDRTDAVKTTDDLKGVASWRHDFTRKQFTQYRPTIEWDRVPGRRAGTDSYVLLQQEIGFGYTFVAKPARKLRLGVSENMFDTWSTGRAGGHSSRAVESLFDEAEFKMPWRMTLTQRGVWYPITNQSDGWEDQIELSKQLTETLSVSLRHEIRRRNPDGASQDYTRLKFLLGLDF